jgi:prevent-host-death family protein
MTGVKTSGIREARQNLSILLEEVKKGREVLITDRGRPVARLAPPRRTAARPFPDRAAFRRRMPVLSPPLSSSIAEAREDRL